MYRYQVECTDLCRLDQYLAKRVDFLSRNQIQKLIEAGDVKVNSHYVNKKYILQSGDVIEMLYEECVEPQVLPEKIALDILYEDESIAVINKPKNMVVHIDDHNYSGTLVNALMYHFDDLSDAAGHKRMGIVHRLDKDTSGVMLITKTNGAYYNIKAQFNSRKVFKRYIALVHGGFSLREGVIDLDIGRHPKNRLLRTVGGENSKPAVTKYRVLESVDKFSLVECILETGRTHQIRVHMKHINHPIYGDNLYGTKEDRNHPTGQYLHSLTIGFYDDKTGEYREFSADLPKYFMDTLKKLKFEYARLWE